MVVVLLAVLAYMTINRQKRLARGVADRTQKLAALNSQLAQEVAERGLAEEALRESETRSAPDQG